MRVNFRRHARHLGVAVLVLALTACATPAATPASAQVSPFVGVQFELIDDLCDQLDPVRLIELAGSVVTTNVHPPRPDVERRMCTISATTPEKTSLAYVRIGTGLRSPDTEAENDSATPSASKWSPVPEVGDSAMFQYFAHDELVDSPVLNRPVRDLNAWLIAHAGNATITVHLMLYADIEFDRAQIEELLSEYAREALELMRS